MCACESVFLCVTDALYDRFPCVTFFICAEFVILSIQRHFVLVCVYVCVCVCAARHKCLMLIHLKSWKDVTEYIQPVGISQDTYPQCTAAVQIRSRNVSFKVC